ncbi:transglycosylase domain-containing protein [Ancylobacter dichloromethanicus]|uniref:Biosynthetic peptidoglycan transglycosylase n=1 Tax=Ancylobacter dichloromethanicus TaxID=518825 RepID=A0A9W6J7M5_9HYPH|nr:transglycosylase domain-containing protein [Ancylobacter dichloromethanicus]MBS7555590.1 transglycosylase domain-containing protein [Ancylobacter dichloromethanicus]GLK70793.1 monofunctional biosynthetic peptidoglycan transglycosylase [Ancylobacter dichloromethanicus]
MGRVWRWVWKIALVAVATPLVLGLLYNVVPAPSTLMLARWAGGQPVERVWLPLDDISPNLIRSVLASEDARFCTHSGVDMVELQGVIDESDGLNAPRGASTITMQLVKNLFLWNGRSFIRKGLELPLALYLNVVMPKRRQLELYLNLAEWGPDGQFGVEAGARRAFRRGAGDLTARQAALLAVMLPNPHRRDAGKPGRGLSRLAANLQARIPREGAELTACL